MATSEGNGKDELDSATRAAEDALMVEAEGRVTAREAAAKGLHGEDELSAQKRLDLV